VATKERKLLEVFKIVSFYDDHRWDSLKDFSLINYFSPVLQDDAKLLTHWICYITDRQMPVQRIWEIGGFVFSELIHEVKQHKNLDLLDPGRISAFIKKEQGGDKYTFISRSKAASNPTLAKYRSILDPQGRVIFKSRFTPADYLAMLYTLTILEDYEYRISRFIKEAYCNNKGYPDFLKRLLFSLYLLTYDAVGAPTSRDLADFSGNARKASERKKRNLEILHTRDKFNREYTDFLKDRIFKQKRAWCSLRDFLKLREFKQCFRQALREELLDEADIDRLFSLDSLTQLEIPGDVWNNSKKLRDCILKDTEYATSTRPINELLREYFNRHRSNMMGYPEQFDITFDFVQRMCERGNCSVCPIDRIGNPENHFDRLCSPKENSYCPVSLTSCGYKSTCSGLENCKLRQIGN
jgi:hypothetical protein